MILALPAPEEGQRSGQRFSSQREIFLLFEELSFGRLLVRVEDVLDLVGGEGLVLQQRVGQSVQRIFMLRK